MGSELRIRKTQSMYHGRTSNAGARYFITMCVRNREGVLCGKDGATKLFGQLESQQMDGDFELHCCSLMQDHLHLIFRLGDRLSLGRAIAKFKAKTNRVVNWQDDFYDRQLKAAESEDQYGFYVFMNPNKANLLSLDKNWPYWRRWRESPYKLEELLKGGKPVPNAWLKMVDDLKIPVGLDQGPTLRGSHTV